MNIFKHIKESVDKRPVIVFIFLTYTLTMVAWGGVLTFYGGLSIEELFASPSSLPLVYLGAAAPSIIAIMLTWVSSGRSGLKKLGQRFIRVKVNPIIVLLALGIPFLIAFASTFLFQLFSPGLGNMTLPTWYLIVPPWTLLLFVAGPLCEETGWRGYLQPKLLERTTPINAIMILGVVWCFWHVPLSFTPGTTPPLDTASARAIYCLSTIATTAILMALVVAGKNSIFVAMLFHWASNAALGNVVLPLYPNAENGALMGVEMIQLGLTILTALIAVLWLHFNKEKLQLSANLPEL